MAELISSKPQPLSTADRSPVLAAIEGVLHLFQADLLRRRSVHLLLLAVLLIPCALRTYLGAPIPMKRYGPDAFILLDGAWRVLNGQVPHVDFYSSFGPVMYLLVALGMKLASTTALGLSYCQALVGVVLAFWSFRISTRRLAAVPAVLFCVFVVLLSLAPYEIGESPASLAPSTTYNRYSYALLALIVLESLCPPRTVANGANEELAGGISTGIALGITLFLKISFFLAGVPLLAALCVCRRQERRRWIGCASGFGLLFLAVMVYLRFDVAVVWHDLRLTASTKKIPLQRAVDVLLPTFGPMLWLIFLSFFASFVRTRGEGNTFPRHLTFAAVVVAIVNYLVILGNHQDSGLPLGVALSIILLGVICGGRSYPKSDRNLTLYRAVLFIWSAFFFIPPIASDLAGLGYGAIEANRYRRSSVLEFDSPRLKPMLFVGPREFGSSYVTCINEGIHMLRGQPANETIATLSYTNPFPYALGRTPAHGGTTYFWVDYNFSDRMRPPGELMLGDASIVMVPKYWSDGGAVDGFGGYVKRNYNLAQESPCWALYRRK
jgi:hypothetical protein